VPLIRRSGRPGLLGSIGRTAVIAGTATMTTQIFRHHSDQRAAGQQGAAEQQAAAARSYLIPTARQATATPPNAAEPDLVDRLSELAELRAADQLTEEEFRAAKAQLLR
jgi:hypothetical protein